MGAPDHHRLARPAKLSVNTQSLVGIRARYVQPYEDHVLGGGVGILDASIEAIERAPDGGSPSGLRRVRRRSGHGVRGRRGDRGDRLRDCPLRDLPTSGVATFGQSKLPAQTPWWESATLPGVFFAGTIGQGSKGLQKHGIPANSGAVHGARYNARCVAGRIAGNATSGSSRSGRTSGAERGDGLRRHRAR